MESRSMTGHDKMIIAMAGLILVVMLIVICVVLP